MEERQVLHMNGGIGEASYANNSSVQRRVISMVKPTVDEAITSLYLDASPRPSTLAIADLGCSSGPNSLLAVSQIIQTVENLRKETTGHDEHQLEYQIFLNDLPGNDFNAIFRALPKTQGERQGPCFFAGVPGSFYHRIFPSKCLHFVHSSYSLHWLSQVPEGVLESNKGNIYMARSSPPGVIDAYYRQFQSDFSAFLECRAAELVPGGCMVLTILGRRSKEDQLSADPCRTWGAMAMALNEMVSEGLIEEEKMRTFHIPQYTPSPEELEAEVIEEGSFAINRMEVSEVPMSDGSGKGPGVVKIMRAVAEPLLIGHFGEGIMADLFSRYRLLIDDRVENNINLTISLTIRPA